ncbi:MAG: imidazoleglycerol-phosphate dehydratase HisB [Candidatus Promineifilaceae bacterium]|nr:imidazoleglycerol-phosphate dehydratase HisB [Candidatus Promineifilaceae bacterium]
MGVRSARVQRKTYETEIEIFLAIDGDGNHKINTGIGFFDHMLTALTVHGMFDLEILAKGDLHVDNHHTIEDVGIVLGQAIAQAVGNRKGIYRMGHAYVPMDESLGFVALDLSGRPYTVFQSSWNTTAIGQFPTDLVQHFFESLAAHAKLTLHARVEGRNDHHKAEALFKALGRALRAALSIDARRTDVASTKGTLT